MTLQEILAKYGNLETYLAQLPGGQVASERQRLQGEMQKRYFSSPRRLSDKAAVPTKPMAVIPPAPVEVAPERQYFDKYKAGFANATGSQSEQLGRYLNQHGVGFDQQREFQNQDKFAAILQSLKGNK